jgi:hypothetical protein
MLALSALLVTSPAAFADDPSDVEVILDSAASWEVSEVEPALGLDAFSGKATLSDAELGSHRAREALEVQQITINDQEQDGTVTDNVAIGTTNGGNQINGDAFRDSAGFMSTVQNTGNNVLIQTSTIINVTVETPSQ